MVQGGPGAGKTEAALARIVRLVSGQRRDSAPFLALVTSEIKADAFRRRLARALSAMGCSEATVQGAAARVVSIRSVAPLPSGGGDYPSACSQFWSAEALDRAALAAGELAPHVGLGRHLTEARDLLLETMWLLVAKGPPRGSDGGDGDWFRRGVALVDEAVRFAQVETLRRLRMLEGKPGWIGDLGRQLRRPSDVAQRSRDLRSAVDRALRSTVPDRAELERLRSWLDVAAIDLTEAARREAVAAVARRRLWETAATVLHELGIQPAGPGADVRPEADGLAGAVGDAQHVIVDDAHDLANGDLDVLRQLHARASLFVTGDQRAAAWRDGSHTRFRALLREAGRAVVLLEAPRFGAGLGRFVNALGSRLWPASEPGGYAPAIARLDSDPSAASPVELWLVRRRSVARPDGGDHPEPIGDARLREARAVAAGARRMLGGARAADAAVLVQDECGREAVEETLEAEGAGKDVVDVRTVDECQGLEWSTVFVTGLDEPLGGPAPRRAWMDAESALAVVWPEDERGRRIWPFSSLLLAQRAAAVRDVSGRQRLFLAAARARTRLILSGVTREKAAGGDTCVAPVEWLRRQLGLTDLVAAQAHQRLGEAGIDVRIVDADPLRAE